MRLFIAEKPSLARAIADRLGNGSKDNGCIRCGDDVVTWCFGHLLEPCYPEDYKPEYSCWQPDQLPIIPETWRSKPRAKAAAQLKIIGDLLRQASSVVNAGDPDREGQLLVDEVLEHFQYQGPVSRIWLASLDDRSVRKALDSIRDNAPFASLRDAARARQQADWLVGMNATRAMTIAGRNRGRSEVLSVGRVQTPTLALVVARDNEIASFTPSDYFVLRACLKHSEGEFEAVFVPDAEQAGLDTCGRLADVSTVQSLIAGVKGCEGTVATVTREAKNRVAPLPHCLSSLQKEASSRLSMTAKAVLDTAQSLYEKKLTTYPRTDCRYLPEEQFDAAGPILTMLAGVPGMEHMAGNADASLKSSAWNTKKVTAHHAIIPTGEVPGKLSEREHDLYTLIVTAYCLQFYPAMRYEAQKITLSLNDTLWECRGRRILEPGWTAIFSDDEEEEDQALPSVEEGDMVLCQDVQTLKKQTSPPSRFTEGTLIEAMAHVHRFVADPSAKAVLRENEGIGTEATRAGVIETLKQRGYLISDKKALVSTPLGRELIAMTPDALKDPVTTAAWESRLEAVAQGKESLSAFMDEQIRILPGLINAILDNAPAPAFPCPTCGKAMNRRKGKKPGSWYWGCTAWPSCSMTVPDANGKPGTPRKKPELSQYSCSSCGKPLILRSGAKGGFYGCSGYPGCKKTWPVGPDDAPDFDRKEKQKR